MWYACGARPGAQVMVGLRNDVTRDQFERAIGNGTAEECLQHVPVHNGDAIFVPAGTAHTIGPGLVLCEIQQQSDLTYRVYDYKRRDAQGRSRPLHVDKALAVMRFGAQRGGKVAPVTIQSGARNKSFIAACRYFATEKWEFEEKIDCESTQEHFDLLIVMEGGGQIHFGLERLEYRPAQVWLIPAALGKFEMKPNTRTSLLRTYVPSNLNGVRRELAANGVCEADIARLVHE